MFYSTGPKSVLAKKKLLQKPKLIFSDSLRTMVQSGFFLRNNFASRNLFLISIRNCWVLRSWSAVLLPEFGSGVIIRTSKRRTPLLRLSGVSTIAGSTKLVRLCRRKRYVTGVQYKNENALA